MTREKDPPASPPRVVTHEGAFGELLRAAMAYTPPVDQAAAFRALADRQRAEQRAPFGRWALAFALAAASLGLWLALFWRKAPPDVSSPSSTLSVSAQASTALSPGDNALSDGTTAKLAPDSAARLEARSTGPRVALDHGTVALIVAKQPPGQSLEVSARSYRFVALGTAFAVTSSSERVLLDVSEGRVAVYEESRLLAERSAGERWSSDGGREREAPRANLPRAEPRASGSSVSRAAAPAVTAPVAELDCLALARAGQAREAERCFREQSQRAGLGAELALFELSRLRSDVLGDAGGALAALEEYRSRFPRGSLRAEVDLSHVHLLARAGRSREVLAETEALLRNGNASERGPELRMLRANTLRTLQDFERAEREYAEVEQGGGRFSAEATYQRGVCLEALGERSTALKAYRRYLKVPGGPRELDARRRLEALEP